MTLGSDPEQPQPLYSVYSGKYTQLAAMFHSKHLKDLQLFISLLISSKYFFSLAGLSPQHTKFSPASSVYQGPADPVNHQSRPDTLPSGQIQDIMETWCGGTGL